MLAHSELTLFHYLSFFTQSPRLSLQYNTVGDVLLHRVLRDRLWVWACAHFITASPFHYAIPESIQAAYPPASQSTPNATCRCFTVPLQHSVIFGVASCQSHFEIAPSPLISLTAPKRACYLFHGSTNFIVPQLDAYSDSGALSPWLSCVGEAS